MTKKEFVWLGIRFLGVTLFVFSFEKILAALFSIPLAISLVPACGFEVFILATLLQSIFGNAYPLIIALYLAFFGKSLFNLIHRRSRSLCDHPLTKPDIAEILIRFIGVIWLYVLLRHAVSWGLGSISFWLISRINDPVVAELRSKLQNLLSAYDLWRLFAVIGYAFLAWYFLYRGKLLIGWLNHLWHKTDLPPDQSEWLCDATY